MDKYHDICKIKNVCLVGWLELLDVYAGRRIKSAFMKDFLIYVKDFFNSKIVSIFIIVSFDLFLILART